jgi:hypothetical protein
MNTNSQLPNLIYIIASLYRLFVRETMTASRTSVIFPVLMDVAAEHLRNTLHRDILWGLNGSFERGVDLAKQGALTHHLTLTCRISNVCSRC